MTLDVLSNSPLFHKQMQAIWKENPAVNQGFLARNPSIKLRVSKGKSTYRSLCEHIRNQSHGSQISPDPLTLKPLLQIFRHSEHLGAVK